MNILFLSHYKFPHVGGVEKHIFETSKTLKVKGRRVVTISETDINYPRFKFVGLFYVWCWLFKNRRLIENADAVHCHDVFIWYLPFKILYPNKTVITTVHGLEWDSPLRKSSLWQKKLAVSLSSKTVGIGTFLEKYINVKFDLISYGATTIRIMVVKKNRNRIVYVGRLEKNTGLLQFLDWLRFSSAGKKKPKYKVDFCGDGPLRQECEKYGKVHGFTDPSPFYKKAKICVPGGYLAALEALSYSCELKLFWNNQVKEDYWKMSPFYKLKGRKLKEWARQQTWEKLANEYLDLYNNS